MLCQVHSNQWCEELEDLAYFLVVDLTAKAEVVVISVLEAPLSIGFLKHNIDGLLVIVSE